MKATQFQVRSADDTRHWWVPIGAAAAMAQEFEPPAGEPFDPRAYPCDWCGALPGESCTSAEGTRTYQQSHSARHKAHWRRRGYAHDNP